MANSDCFGLEIGTGDKPHSFPGIKMVYTDLVTRVGIDKELDANKKFPFKDNTFNIVCAYGVLEHVTDFYFTINEIHRVLKEDGIFLCDLPHFASSVYFWEGDHKRMGHSRIFHSYVEEMSDKAMRGQSQNRRFELVDFDYVINFGKILKPLLGKKKRFKWYEYYFARVLPFNIDMIYFKLKKKGFFRDEKTIQ